MRFASLTSRRLTSPPGGQASGFNREYVTVDLKAEHPPCRPNEMAPEAAKRDKKR